MLKTYILLPLSDPPPLKVPHLPHYKKEPLCHTRLAPVCYLDLLQALGPLHPLQPMVFISEGWTAAL